MNNILIYLLENAQAPTINQLARTLDINYRTAYEQVKKLEKEGLISTRRVGNALLCSLTGHFNEKLFSAEHQRRQSLLKDKDLNTIHKRFSQAKQDYILLLFGSRVKKTHTETSDIDLLAITQNEQELHDIARSIPKNIHLTTTTYQTFIDMLQTTNTNVGNEAKKHNIILVGIENYYRLLHNVN